MKNSYISQEDKFGVFNIFLSYTKKDYELAFRIAETLRFMGIVVWMDKDNLNMGFQQEQKIIDVIENYDGIISLITPRSMKSNYVILELKAALSIKGRKHDYLILPLLQKISFDELREWSLESLGENLSSYSGHKLEKHVISKHLTNFSSKVLKTLIEVNNEISKLDGITIQLYSKEEQKIQEKSNFVYNFTTLVDNNDRLIVTKIQHAHDCIKKSRDIFSKTINTKDLYLNNPKCHISLSLIFGYIFRQPSGYKLNIKYFDDIFSTDESFPTLEDILLIKENKGSIQKNPIIYEISISNDVTTAVSSLISREKIDYRKRLSIYPSKGPSRTIPFDNQLTNQYATTIAKNIRTQSLEQVDVTIFLFISSPLMISFLIGWNLNASGEIQLMEFHNSSKTYYRTFLLK